MFLAPELVLRPLMLSDTKHRGEIWHGKGSGTKALGVFLLAFEIPRLSVSNLEQ